MAASDELLTVLKRYGLEGLFQQLNDAVKDDPTLVRDTDALFRRVENTVEYQTRFAGNIAREKQGKPVLSVEAYIQEEQAYKTQLQNLGMSQGFYDTQADFARLIANDVSPVEFGARIQQGYNAVRQSNPEVVRQMKELYGVSDADLAEYFIDPDRKRPELDRMALARQARAAQIAAQSRLQTGVGVTSQQAEELATAGVDEADARQGFTQMFEQEQLYRPQMAGEDVIGQEEAIAAAFGTSAAAAQRVATRRRRRQAQFEAGGGFATGQTGVAGLRTAGE
jgi:hypothetical protein